MCIFCRIVSGELPSYKVYEDEQSLAFLDIKPVSPGHILVVPKKHYQNLEEIPLDDLFGLLATVKRLGLLLKKSLGVDGYNLNENNDPVAGQTVPHLHFHLIPRCLGDDLEPWPQREYQAGEAEEIVKKFAHFSENL